MLRQSTSVIVLVGPVLDSSGAAYSGMTIADFNITKNGSTAAMSGNTLTHSHEGHYLLTLTTTNTNTIGTLAISCNKSTYAMPQARFRVLHANVYDVTFGTTALSTYAGGDTAGVTTLLSRITAAVMLAASYSAPPSAATISSQVASDLATAHGAGSWLTATGFAVPGSAMTLTSGERTTLANEFEAQLIDDTDTEKVLEAITNKIAAANPSLGDLTLSAIASAVWSYVQRRLTDATNITSDASPITYVAPNNSAIADIKTKTDQMQFTGGNINAIAELELTEQNIEDLATGIAAQLPTVTVTPISATVGIGEAAQLGDWVAYQYGPLPSGPIAFTQANGNPINLSEASLILIAWLISDHSTVFILTSEASELTVSGAGHNQVTINSGTDFGGQPGKWEMFLKNQSDSGRMLAVGGLTIYDAPEMPE